jgi:hypothetical protein
VSHLSPEVQLQLANPVLSPGNIPGKQLTHAALLQSSECLQAAGVQFVLVITTTLAHWLHHCVDCSDATIGQKVLAANVIRRISVDI